MNRLRVLGIGLLLLCLGMLFAETARTQSDRLFEQRQAFLQARAALASGDRERYRVLLDKLQDYPLLVYLRYQELRGRLKRARPEEVQAFLEQFGDSPPGRRLRSAWLTDLARQRRWSEFLEFYVGEQDTELQCYRLQALLRTGRRQEALEHVEPLWLSGRSQPDACDPVFAAWREAGRLTPDQAWARIRLAVDRGQWTLVSYLGRFLNPADRAWLERWRGMSRDPWNRLSDSALRADSPIAREIMAYGVERIARSDAGRARDRWEQVQGWQDFDVETLRRVDQSIALRAAYQHHPRALDWLAQLDSDDIRVRQWRVRAALRSEDWKAALRWVEAMPLDEGTELQWRYWKARALDALGRPEAQGQFRALAEERDFYGFLAADRLGQRYRFGHDPVTFTEADLAAVEALPGITRARELLRVGLRVDARREWRDALRDLDDRQLELAAVLAGRWGWHDRAIVTVARADHFDDLDLRFPLVYQDLVLKNARAMGLDPAWVYGVMRQESAFWERARSHAGALGLMQLMPSTARETARRLKDRVDGVHDLLSPRKNIRLGAAYLRRVLDSFGGHQGLATAAYNAGPGRVRSWLPGSYPLAADIWVDTVPFNETRRYVKRVMTYTAVYEHRLERPVRPLEERLPPVPATVASLTDRRQVATIRFPRAEGESRG